MEVRHYYPCGSLHPDWVKKQFNELDVYDQAKLIVSVCDENENLLQEVQRLWKNKK